MVNQKWTLQRDGIHGFLFFSDCPDKFSISFSGRSNIYWYLTDAVITIDINLMKEKLVDAVYRQFIMLRNIPMYIFTNISLIAISYLLLRQRC